MNFALPADYRVKTLWNMNATLIPIVIGALGIIPKGLANQRDRAYLKRYLQSAHLEIIGYIYIFKKKNKDRLIMDYKFISILFFCFWCEPKTRRNLFLQDSFRSNG